MPIQRTGFLSRYDLEHPEAETAPAEPNSLHELVLKYNPNHGADGRFASSGGGRKGGTEGTPTEDAFGKSLGGYRARNIGNPFQPEARRQASNAAAYRQTAEEFAGRAGDVLGGVAARAVDAAGVAARNLVEKLPTNLKNKILETVRPGALIVPKQFSIPNAQKVRNYVEMFGKHPPRKKV